MKIPFLRQIDESEAAREKTLVARWGRFVTGQRARACSSSCCWCSSPSRRRPRSFGSVRPTRARSRRSRPRAARTTCSPRASAPASTGPSRSSSTSTATTQAPQRIYDRVRDLPGVASAGEPQFNDEKTVAIVFVTPDSAPQDEATADLVNDLRDDVIPRRVGDERRRRLRLRPDGRVRRHRRPDHGAAAVVPALRDRRHVHRARDGVPLDRHLADRGDHDDPVRVRRLRRAHAWSSRRATCSG